MVKDLPDKPDKYLSLGMMVALCMQKIYLISAVSHLTARLDGGDEHFSFTSSFPLIDVGPSTDKLSGPSFT